MTCIVCGQTLSNWGAESRGDGDIYDVMGCDEHGAIYEVHASYCKCGCGGGEINEVYDPNALYEPYEEIYGV